ncbi:MAG: CRISPR-associated endonuclease Cas2 [Chloroflexota bacterium]|nr:CRISPR-associated endonuclease Cas2 [Chloroflexota bacterium]
MQLLLVYDIPDDKIRTKVADICLDYALDRIQYSTFQGELNRVYQEELMEKVAYRLGQRPGKIQLFPICQKDWQARLEILQEEKDEPTTTGE